MAMTILLAALAAQALPTPRAVAAWETLPDDAAGHYFLDPASISRDGDIARALVRGVANQVQASGRKTMMMRFRIDCRARAIGIEAADGYDAAGRLLGSQRIPPEQVASAPIGDRASLAALADRACRAPAGAPAPAPS